MRQLTFERILCDRSFLSAEQKSEDATFVEKRDSFRLKNCLRRHWFSSGDTKHKRLLQTDTDRQTVTMHPA